MTRRLELYYPVKPHRVAQAWGILNPAYLRFGFTRHNGVDIEFPGNNELRAPVRMRIYDQKFYPQGGGNQVSCVSTEKWIVPHLGPEECYILLNFAHNKNFLRSVGDVLEIGDQVAVPDSTGFSTGPHIHFGVYRANDSLTLMDKNEANGSFDPAPYWNGSYAKDYGIYRQIRDLLRNFLLKLGITPSA